MNTDELKEERLRELFKYDVLDTEEEKDFNDIVELASQICQTPISLISLIDDKRQWVKAKIGIEAKEAPLEVAFCTHVIENDFLLEVENALNDYRFSNYPSVLNDPHIRFYAGVPLISKNGYRLGTLCVIDQKPRKLEAVQKLALKILSEQVIKLFELRLRNRQFKVVLEKAEVLGKLAIIELDLRYSRWDCSNALNNLLGFEENDRHSIGDFLKVIHPQDVESIIETFRYCLKEERRFNEKFRIVKKNSSEEIAVQAKIEFIRSEQGDPIKIVGIIQDITETAFRDQAMIQEIDELKRLIKGSENERPL